MNDQTFEIITQICAAIIGWLIGSILVWLYHKFVLEKKYEKYLKQCKKDFEKYKRTLD